MRSAKNYQVKYNNHYETWIEARASNWMTKEEVIDYLKNSNKVNSKYAKDIRVIQHVDVTHEFYS